MFVKFCCRASMIKMASLLTEDVSMTEIFNSSCDEDFEGFDEDAVAAAEERLR